MDVIYLAAGLGMRANLKIPKQFYRLYGKPLFIYALEVLQKHKSVESIVITYNAEFKSEYKKILKDYGIKNYILVEGGNTRQVSVYKALNFVKSNNVIIHEAARPMISSEFIDEIISSREEVAVVPTIHIPFTVSIGNEYMQEMLNRDKLRNIQLPQYYDTQILKQAHEKAIEDHFFSTEDSTLVFRMNKKVKFIAGRESNIKVTTKRDIIMLEGYLNGR